MCGTIRPRQSMYSRYPSPAAIALIIDKSPKTICKKCAQREIGSKRKKELNELEKDS